MTLLHKLRTKKHFTEIEKIIADYVLSHGESVLGMSVRQLAQQTHVSSATIIRFCQKLDLLGFNDFKIQLSRELERENYQTNPLIDANIPFIEHDSFITISKKIADLTKESITKTQQLMQEQQLNRAVNMLLDAENIYAIGVSHSFLRATEFQAKLLRIGIYVKLVHLQPDQVFFGSSCYQKRCSITNFL